MRRRLGGEVGDQHGWRDALFTLPSVPRACQEATTRAAINMLTSGVASAAWTPNVLALAQSVQTAMSRRNLSHLALYALIAGATGIAIAGLLAGVSDRFRPAIAFMAGPDSPPQPQTRSEQASEPSARKIESDRWTITGKVLDPDGKPLVGAQVYLVLADAKPSLHKLATSGADGRFEAKVPRQEMSGDGAVDRRRLVTIAATEQGYGPDWASAAVAMLPDQPKRADLTLRMAKDDVPITGRLVTGEGRPVVGARVVALTITYGETASGEPVPWDGLDNVGGWTDLRLGGFFPEVVSDAEGRFRMSGIGRDRLVTLRITGKGIAQQDVQVQTRATAAEERPVAGQTPVHRPIARSIYPASFVLTTVPARVIEGTVREQGSGRPIAGAIVNTLRTDHEGKFRIDGLSPEFTYPLHVVGPAGEPYFRRSLSVSSKGSDRGPVHVDVELSRAILIRGRVMDSGTGRPLVGTVHYAPLRGNPNLDRFLGDSQNDQTLDDHGEFTLVGMPGPGVVMVTAGDGETLFFPRSLGATRTIRDAVRRSPTTNTCSIQFRADQSRRKSCVSANRCSGRPARFRGQFRSDSAPGQDGSGAGGGLVGEGHP